MAEMMAKFKKKDQADNAKLAQINMQKMIIK